MIREIALGALQEFVGIVVHVGGALLDHHDLQLIGTHERRTGRFRREAALTRRPPPVAYGRYATDEVHP